jgi:ribonuclease E
MLIDSTHPEETRVVILSGNRLEEFDFETSTKKQIKGNIYLAKVTRVEPSLQAAFIEYGGNRHGFLAFNEIHPDYYQIPISDREALAREEAREEKNSEAREEEKAKAREIADRDDDEAEESAAATADAAPEGDAPDAAKDADDGDAGNGEAADGEIKDGENGNGDNGNGEPSRSAAETGTRRVETVSGDEAEELRRRRTRSYRRYKIQEVIKRRQILLVQVVKEERGTKGAALTSYISLAGRFCVLMPNTARGGGISRKIVDPDDRKRLKSIAASLDVPEGMGVILRTAGMGRSKPEVRRDFNYLIKIWTDIRELTLKSIAPALVHEEANLIKRSIRDLYSKDIEEILVDGDDGYRAAKEFMRTLMPSHAKYVGHYEDRIPLFYRYQVEGQLDAMHSPVVGLRSGGYIVINPTEALVAIDVNSGRATRERNIEETAYKTNLEAAEEVARQLRLRDLSGLIVIDFIDMEESRNNRTVERRLKEAVKTDRARIQMGHISPFGLLEMSRQRLRPSLLEASTLVCSHCNGAGHVRSTESTALHVLRAIEEEGIRERSTEVRVVVPTTIALYILNQKRDILHAIEERYAFRIWLEQDDELIPPDYRLERIKSRPEAEGAKAAEEAEADKGKRRRRGRRGKGEDAEATPVEAEATAVAAVAEEAPEPPEPPEPRESREPREAGEAGENGAQRKRRRRGRRGGRRRRAAAGETPAVEIETGETPAAGEAAAAEAEPTAEPGLDEPAKPARARRSRRPKADASQEAAAAAEPVEESPAEAVDAAPPEEARPGRSRRGGRRKKTDEATAAPAGESSPPAESKTEAAPDKTVSEAEAAPDKTESEAEAAPDKTVSEPEEAPKKPRRRTRKAKPADEAPADASDAGETPAAEEPIPSPPVVTPASLPEHPSIAAREVGDGAPKEPSRRGWWQKIVN